MDDHYILEDPREAQRLAEKVDARRWVADYLHRHIQPGQTILDVGCGPGVMLREIALAYPNVHAIGVDIGPYRISVAKQTLSGLTNAAADYGNVGALPFPDGHFDIVYSRFLMEYIADREQAVSEMARVCRTGGLVLLQDLDGQLVWHDPPDEHLQSEIETAIRALQTTGFDPYVGRKLYRLAKATGLINIQVAVSPYHLYAGRIDDREYRRWELKLDIALPLLTKAFEGDESRAMRLRSRFLSYLLDENTLTYSTLFTVNGRK